MSDPRQELDLGGEVFCTDGPAGTLVRVVIDPTADVLTHLVVRHDRLAGRLLLVPMPLVDPDPDTHGLLLRCTSADFEALPEAEETRFVPGAPGPWDYRQDQMVSWPYYGLGLGLFTHGAARSRVGATYDHIPKGEVEVRRGDSVHAVDGPVGRVEGLVIDPADDHVTHVLLADGHLWGERRVAIPMRDVTHTQHGVQVALTRAQIRDLPDVSVPGLGHLAGVL